MDAGADVATDLVQIGGLPFLGSLFPIRRNALGFFSRMFREHGDRVQLRVLGRKVILLCHPDDIEEVLVRDRDSFGRSAEIRKLRPIFGNGLLASEGAFWRRQRNIVQPSFQHSAMTGSHPMNPQVANMVDAFPFQHINSPNKSSMILMAITPSSCLMFHPLQHAGLARRSPCTSWSSRW